MFNAIDRVMLAVQNLDRGRDAYRAVLGREPSEEGSDTTLGVAYCRFRLLHSCIELISPLAGHEGNNPLFRRAQWQLRNHGEGLMAIAFASQQLDECQTALNERGVMVEEFKGDIKGDSYLSRSRMIQLTEEHCLGLGLFAVETCDRLQRPFAVAIDSNQSMGVIDDVDHIVLNTRDSDALKACLSEQLGLSLRLDQCREEWGVRQLFYRVGANILEVMEFLSEEQKAKADYFWGIALAVPRLDPCLERLKEGQVDVSKARKGRKRHSRVATLKSHDCGAATLLISQEQA
ncbi:VOC family protein [Pseudoteredinibacter isoporae]|uniref:VOC family protein n=1 Tax=Pseudoteredinibacter isoporae TaxID=570281 RepID=UPI00333FA722